MQAQIQRGRSMAVATLAEMSAFVAQIAGLHFPEPRWADLERAMQTTASSFGYESWEAFAAKLFVAGANSEYVSRFMRHLTVGETYFFREPRAFEVLRTDVMPRMLSIRGRSRRLRIWSLGCATGEEAYSLAILIEQFFPQLRHRDVSIVGTDLNSDFISKAAAGVYSRWSFRATPEGVRNRYFESLGGGKYRVVPELRRSVQFECRNAVQMSKEIDGIPGIFDVIFCRNMLLYFTPEHARMVCDQLSSRLTPDGVLVVSASEMLQVRCDALEPDPALGPNFFRVRPGSAEETTSTRFHPTPKRVQVSREIEVTQEDPRIKGSQMPAAPRQKTDTRARSLADEGMLDAARACCEGALLEDGSDASHHFLLAQIHLEAAEWGAAEKALIRAIYLDPALVACHLALSHVAQTTGRPNDARRHIGNAIRLLESCAADDPVPYTDGLTAKRLLEITRDMLEGWHRA